MVERSHLIGARLVIHSSPGAGTTVDVSVPATIIG
jgi:signal transduction histidine kinase